MKEFLELLESQKSESEAKLSNVLVLAFVGDSLYCSFVRVTLANECGEKARGLHLKANKFVKAESQAIAFRKMKEDGIFTDAELGIANRARNAKLAHTAKNASIEDYRHATAFESVLGYLFFANQKQKLVEYMANAMKIIKESLNN